MRKLLLFVVAILTAAITVASAEYGGPPTPQSVGFEFVNVRPAAAGDTLSFSDAVMTSSSAALASASATFTAADVGKRVLVQGAGAAGVPLSTTIAAYVDAHDVTLTDAASTTPQPGALSAVPATTQSGAGSYAPGDTLTCSGGTGTACVLGIFATQLTSAARNADGSGGTAGACVLTGTTGTGDALFSINATITAGAISALGSIKNSGSYIVNPTNLSAEPVTGCGLVGATLTIKMGVNRVSVQTAGAYSVKPSNPVSTTTSGSGTGATLTVTFATAGVFTYGTDDTAAITAAINTANASFAAGFAKNVYFPAGNYFITAALPQFSGPNGAIGDGPHISNLVIDSSVTGDIFSWTDAGFLSSLPSNGPTMVTVSSQQSGPQVSDISIIGTLGASNTQNAFMFYDRTDKLAMHDVTVDYLHGTCLSVGTTQNQTSAWLREGYIDNVEFRNCGTSSLPSALITSAGTGDATNNVNGHNWRIIFPAGGGGLVINNSNTHLGVRHILIDGLMLHGIQAPTTPVTADLMTIGDGTLAGVVSDVNITKLVGNAAYTGQYTVTTTAPTAGTQPYDIKLEGSITSGARGINIAAGRNVRLQFQNISTTGTNITVGASPLVGAGIQIEPGPTASAFTYSIDTTSASNVSRPVTVPVGSGLLTVPQFSLSNSLSSLAWTTSGLGFIISPGTYTDTSSSGTVASIYAHKIGAPVLAASSSVTCTACATLDIEPPTGGTNVTITTASALRLGGRLDMAGAAIGSAANISSSNTAAFLLSNNTASSTQPTLSPNRNSTTTGWGAASSGAIDGIVGGTDVFRLGTGSHAYAIAFGTAAANETGYVCYLSSSTPANELLLDTVTCLASLEEFKNIQPGGMQGALGEVMQMHPFWYTWNQKTHPTTDRHVQPGLGAHAMEKIDPRLVTYDSHGKLKGVRYDQMSAVLVAAIQEQQHEIIWLWLAIAGLGGWCVFLPIRRRKSL
jgi:hypothetical protein